MGQILGVTVTTVANTNSGYPACLYSPTGGKNQPAATIIARKTNGRSEYNSVQSLSKNLPGYQNVDGIGDGAFYIEAAGTLSVLKGESSLNVTVDTDEGQRLTQAKQIASIAVTRL
jgi:hypothetical protein